MSGKTPIYIFSTFISKINKFERKKIRKKTKKSKNLKVAGNYPKPLIHTSFSIFFMKNQNNQLLKRVRFGLGLG
jgi:hypothetical protein